MLGVEPLADQTDYAAIDNLFAAAMGKRPMAGGAGLISALN